MSAIRHFIGIDISKAWVDIAARCPERGGKTAEFRFENNQKDIKKIKPALKEHGITLGKKTLVTFEHIGPYSKLVERYCIANRCSVCQESGLKIKRSLGIQRGKSDKIDARRILDYSIRNVDKLILSPASSPTITHLKDLLSMRERFKKIEYILKCSLSEKTGFFTKKYLRTLSRLQNETIAKVTIAQKEIDAEIKKIANKDRQVAHKMSLITSVPGVGPIVAVYLICSTRNFTAFSKGSQLASYAGCAPFEYSSGSSIQGKSRISKLANKKLKAMIHLGALSCLKAGGEFRKYYDRKIKEGKHAMSVMNAIRRKILVRVSAVVKRDSPYMKTRAYARFSKGLSPSKTDLQTQPLVNSE